jgi:solute carrier family 25 protein 39/40
MVASEGVTSQLLRTLYAGAVEAAAASVVVGAVHYLTFCATRRALMASPYFSGGGGSSGAGSSGGQGQGRADAAAAAAADAGESHLVVSHGFAGTHFLPTHDHQGIDADDFMVDPAVAASSSSSSSSSLSQRRGSHAGASTSTSASESERDRRLAVNVCAAVVTAMLTALVEAPVELFRHRKQYG